MDDLKPLIRTILDQGHLVSIASVDESGPWVSDVIYTFDDALNLYWVSQLAFRHSKAYVRNPNAAGAITVVEKPEGKGEGLQLAGSIIVLAQIPEEPLKRYSKKRNSKTPWELQAGEAWYKLTPSTIDVIHEPTFGFTKKTLSLG